MKIRRLGNIFNYDRKELIKLLKENNYIECALKVGKEYIEKAKEDLNKIDNFRIKKFYLL